MSDLGQLLQVIHDSRNSWRTFRGEYRLWRNRERSNEAFTEMAKRSGATAYGALALARKGDPPPAESEGRWRIWVERPDSIREEFEGTTWETRSTVKVGERWWNYDEHWGARSNEGEEDVGTDVCQFSGWLEPAKILGSLRFQPLGPTEVAGRAALRALATLPDGLSVDDDRLDWDLNSLGAEAEEYELAVDREMGTLLRVEARFGGEPFLIGEAEIVAFDEDFPPETFVFTPPEGEEIQPLDSDRATGDQPIHEAAAEAPFTVFILPRLPEGWTMHAYSFRESERPKRGHIVGVSYHADTGAARLNLSERAHSEEGWTEHEAHWDFERVERGDVEMNVHHRSDDVPQSMVLVTRDETDITISSEELSGEKLIEVAVDLVPAPTAPPEL